MITRLVVGIAVVSLGFLAFRGMLPNLPNYALPTVYFATILCISMHYMAFGKRAKIGELAKSIGLLNDDDIETVLSTQKNVKELFGKIAIEKKLLSEREVSLLLEIQAS